MASATWIDGDMARRRVQDLERRNQAFQQRSIECRCDPPGSGEEHCTGHCVLRAEIERLKAYEQMWHEQYASDLVQARAEIERCREVVKTFTLGNAVLEVENVRLRTAVLAYDDAIRDAAKLGNQWVRDTDKLDDLYAEMVTAAGRDIEA